MTRNAARSESMSDGADALSKPGEASFSAWAGARRVPLTLGLCVGLCALAVGYPWIGSWMSLRSETAARAASLGKAAPALADGLGAANAALASDARWRRAFGAARFEADPLDPSRALLRLKMDQATCGAWAAQAPGVEGLVAIEAMSRRVWARGGHEADQGCPAGMDAASLVLSARSAPR